MADRPHETTELAAFDPGDPVRRERVLDKAMALAGVASWVWRAEEDTIEWSPNMYALTGVDPSVTPTIEGFHALVHEEDRERVVAIAERAMTTGFAEPHEYRIRRADDGAERWVQTSGEVVRAEDGTIAGFVGAMLDLTDRRALEARAREGQRLESIGRLASGIAHDLNNLLTVILTSVAIVELDLEAPAPRRAAGHIREAAGRAATLTSQVLAFARQQVTVATVIDLDEAIGGAIDLLEPLTPEGVRIVYQPSHVGLRVLADRGQLDQVLMNLAVNALDAMPGGGRLTFATHPEPGTDRISVSVSDTGAGIPIAIQPHVLEPFYTTKSPGRGTGLGLAVCEGIVARHGGRLSFHSVEGQGTTFVFTLPEPEGAADPVRASTLRPRPRRTGELILLIEDDPLIRELVSNILVADGYRVAAVGSIEAARDRLRADASPIALVLSDWSLPDGSGPQVCEAVADRVAPSRILFVSGHPPAQLAEAVDQDPDLRFLPKPFDAAKLTEAVRDVLAREALRARG
ncbi:MAG: PAS domain-containing protein [Sandaracinaceae bacterium]|nr:PAS domain-containing protein [Sandaracinaceae bacterium]